MARIICPECGKKVSDQETSCIHCGCPLNTQIGHVRLNSNEGKTTDGSNKKSGVPSSRRVSIMSALSLVTSVAAFQLYTALFKDIRVVSLFIVTSVVSLILPVIAKKVRVNRNRKGKVLEIIAIVIGGINFYCVIFALTKWPIFIGYLGWVASAIAYKATCSEK